jgi:hypothetical protein
MKNYVFSIIGVLKTTKFNINSKNWKLYCQISILFDFVFYIFD